MVTRYKNGTAPLVVGVCYYRQLYSASRNNRNSTGNLLTRPDQLVSHILAELTHNRLLFMWNIFAVLWFPMSHE